MREQLGLDGGIYCFANSAVQQILASDQPYSGKWCAFIHSVPSEVSTFKQKDLLKCEGLFTLSEATASALRMKYDVPIVPIKFALAPPAKTFEWERFVANPEPRLICAGNWYRRFDRLMNLNSPFKKTWLQSLRERDLPGVEILPYCSADAYEDYLSQNIMFLDLTDASANNAVVECILRNTPLLINRLPATVEYLGADYPLFFENKDHAEALLADPKALKAAYLYLASLDKSDFLIETFIKSIAESIIYKNLTSCLKVL